MIIGHCGDGRTVFFSLVGHHQLGTDYYGQMHAFVLFFNKSAHLLLPFVHINILINLETGFICFDKPLFTIQ